MSIRPVRRGTRSLVRGLGRAVDQFLTITWSYPSNETCSFAMLIPKREIVELLRRAGHFEVAEEADRSLPDPVELERAAEFGARYGITRDELISRMGGSP